MCLVRNDSVKIAGDRVWKVLYIGGTLESILQQHRWKPGWNEAYILQIENSIVINYGFHAYLKKEDSERDYKKYDMYGNIKYVVVEFTFDLKDLIATGKHQDDGTEQAVFKRLHLAEEEYKRVLSA